MRTTFQAVGYTEDSHSEDYSPEHRSERLPSRREDTVVEWWSIVEYPGYRDPTTDHNRWGGE